MRSGPGIEYPIVVHLRTGVVLRVAGTVTQNGSTWYKVEFAHDLLYPERVKSDWYVSAEFAELIKNETDYELKKGEISTTIKRIIVDVSEEKLYAYDGDKLFMEESISTGLEFTPTPHGTFTVFKMTPSRFMQGPIPGVSDQVYDLPGVPWNLYFTSDGAVIHGAYWHDHFGKPWSHGCVNLSPQNAKKLYYWAVVGMKVTVQD
jgi:lipoprotein-anchoring transpeptidase ErfK/SrfK